MHVHTLLRVHTSMFEILEKGVYREKTIEDGRIMKKMEHMIGECMEHGTIKWLLYLPEPLQDLLRLTEKQECVRAVIELNWTNMRNRENNKKRSWMTNMDVVHIVSDIST